MPMEPATVPTAATSEPDVADPLPVADPADDAGLRARDALDRLLVAAAEAGGTLVDPDGDGDGNSDAEAALQALASRRNKRRRRTAERYATRLAALDAALAASSEAAAEAAATNLANLEAEHRGRSAGLLEKLEQRRAELQKALDHELWMADSIL